MPEKVEVSTIEGTARFTKEVTAAETPKEVKKSDENVKSDDSNIKHDQKSVIDIAEVTGTDAKYFGNKDEAKAGETKKMDLFEGEGKTSKEESKKIEEAKEAIKKWMTSASMQGWRTKQNEVISTSEADSKLAEKETDKKTSKKEFIEKIKKATEDSKEDSKVTSADNSKPIEIKAKPGEADIKKMEAESNKTEESKKIEGAKEAIKKWMTSASMQGWLTKQNEVISTSITESKPTENEMTDNKNESNTSKVKKISKIQFLEKINQATKDSMQDKVTSEADSKPTEKQMDNQNTENLGKVDTKVDADLDEAKNKEVKAKTVNAIDRAREEKMETNEAKEKDSATKRKADETEAIHLSAEKVAKISGESVVETANEKKDSNLI